MRYYEFARPSGLFNWVPNLSALTGFKVGFVDDARRAATPYIVDCHGLAREQMGSSGTIDRSPFSFCLRT
jgi:hypothetical protein